MTWITVLRTCAAYLDLKLFWIMRFIHKTTNIHTEKRSARDYITLALAVKLYFIVMHDI